MDEETAKQLGIGLLAIVVGTSGWLLPHKWNLLRVRRSLGRHLPEHVDRAIPKILGSLCILLGIIMLLGTAFLGKL